MTRLLGRAVLLSAAATLAGGRAQAQGLSTDTLVTQVVARVCTGNAGGTVTPARMAEALVIEAQVAPTLSEMAAIAGEIERTGSSNRVNTRYRNVLHQLQESLARKGSSESKAIAVSPAAPPLAPGASDWLFDSRYTLTCAAEEPAGEPKFTALPPFVVRGSVEALDDVGKARQAAAAAQIGWERARVTNVDGETTHTETFTIDAAAGIAFGNVDRFVILYGDYSRSRSETRDDAGEKKVENVEALELGVHGTARLASTRTTGRIGATFDEVTGARYLRGNLRVAPIANVNLGLCNLNSYRTIAKGIRGRCTLVAEAELRDVLRRGTAQIGTADTLLAVGGSAGIEIGPGIDPDGDIGDGIVASARYTYLPMLNGALRDIDRFEASVSYRWWRGGLGFDVGLTYVDGTERKSFADENRLGFHIGLIY